MKIKLKKILISILLTLILLPNQTYAREVELNKWHPVEIAQPPLKISYLLGELLDLTGLKIKFIRYIRQGEKVEIEAKDVLMLNGGIKNGWELTYNPIPLLYVGEQKINLKLTLIDPAMQYDQMYPEKVEIDDYNNIINKTQEKPKVEKEEQPKEKEETPKLTKEISNEEIKK